MSTVAAYDPDKEIPRHIAIIMDGNGRWAKSRDLPRRDGHRAGAESVEECLKACGDIGVEYLTLYAFSSENWKRPEAEVSALMGLLALFLREKLPLLMENGIRLKVIGEIDRLPDSNRKALLKTMEKTSGNDRLVLSVALSYGSREEIVRATKKLMVEAKEGKVSPEALNPDMFANYLDTAGTPDPDLLIRTSGEFRISNFLLWQISYSEIHITDVFWPDFRRPNLEAAIADYQRRHRRYGGL
ncbi:MAG: di-trans,poly-cis-decaprenylcistransferase [Verrucomicrobiales bacterium]|nr:di-trans,poly-cis-decaprenylcistransferase [Verrucomicrobiales bacterium]